jgi:hypothetical protein
MAVHVDFNVTLFACHDSMVGIAKPPAFINRQTDELLFVKPGDRFAAVHFPGIDANCWLR